MGLDLSVVPKAPLRIAQYAPGSTWGPARMIDFELVWLISGSAIRTVQSGEGSDGNSDASVTLGPGSILVSRPGTWETYTWDPARYSTHAWVHFTCAESTYLPAAEDWPLVRQLDEHPILQGLTTYLLDLATEESKEATARGTEILGLLVDIYVRGPLPQHSLALSNPLVSRVAEYVRTAWQDGGVRLIAVTEIANAFGISRSHLSREFSAHAKVGLAAALELIRLGRAAVSLHRTNQTIEQVARDVGFTSPYHFSRRFSSTYGVAPGRFRAGGLDVDPLSPVRLAGLSALWDATLRVPDGTKSHPTRT